jgi:hypothetical protein
MNLKQFLPYEDYVLVTQLSVDQVCKRLADNIEPKRTFRFYTLFGNSTKPYEGEIIGNRFRISRITNYRNSFLPVIEGEVFRSSGKTQIHIKMKPVQFIIIFISLWLGIVGLACVRMLFTALLNIRQILETGLIGNSPMDLIPFGMLIFMCLMVYFGFKLESKKSKEFLVTLLTT